MRTLERGSKTLEGPAQDSSTGIAGVHQPREGVNGSALNVSCASLAPNTLYFQRMPRGFPLIVRGE